MTDYINATIAGLRGPGLTGADRDFLNAAVAASNALSMVASSDGGAVLLDWPNAKITTSGTLFAVGGGGFVPITTGQNVAFAPNPNPINALYVRPDGSVGLAATDAVPPKAKVIAIVGLGASRMWTPSSGDVPTVIAIAADGRPVTPGPAPATATVTSQNGGSIKVDWPNKRITTTGELLAVTGRGFVAIDANRNDAFADNNFGVMALCRKADGSLTVVGTDRVASTSLVLAFLSFQARHIWVAAGSDTVTVQAIDDAGRVVRPGANAVPRRWSGARMAMSGDSIVASATWVPTMMEKTGIGSFTNWGVSGTRMRDVLTGRTAADFANIDIYGISTGTNDFGNTPSQTPLGAKIDTKDSATFWGAMYKIADTVLAWNGAMRLFFMTPLHRSDEFTVYPGGTPLRAFRDAIIEFCSINGFPVYDQWSRSGIGPYTLGQFLNDEFGDGSLYLHPSAAKGGPLIGKQVAAFMETL